MSGAWPIRLGTAVVAIAALALVLPASVLAHSLNATYESRLPLAVYLVGRGDHRRPVVHLRDHPGRAGDGTADRRRRDVLPPAIVRRGLQAIGLVGWAWIVAQGIAGGSSAGDVATLFLWVYGWVGVAILSAMLGPVWQFLDPFSTLHDLGAGVLRRLGVARLGAGRLPGGSRSLAGDDRLRGVRLARAGAVRRARRRCSS